MKQAPMEMVINRQAPIGEKEIDICAPLSILGLFIQFIRPINSKPKVLEFANFQRFFCCIGCKNNYREKHEGRIRSIVEQYNEMQKEAKKLS